VVRTTRSAPISAARSRRSAVCSVSTD
jgi:hypothetical protein